MGSPLYCRDHRRLQSCAGSDLTIQKLNVREVHQLIQHQERLYAYILALVGDGSVAEDVLQETNLAASRMLSESRDASGITASGATSVYSASTWRMSNRGDDSRSVISVSFVGSKSPLRFSRVLRGSSAFARQDLVANRARHRILEQSSESNRSQISSQYVRRLNFRTVGNLSNRGHLGTAVPIRF